MPDTDPVPYHVFERVQGTVLDRLEEVESIKHELQNGKLREQVALGVADGFRAVLDDKKHVAEFWKTGYDELTKHGANNASQWVGKRLLTMFVTAVTLWGLIWLAGQKSGTH